MHINIEVEKKKGSLELETFRFYLLDHPTRLKLYEYLFSTRPSTRHKFRVKECWRSGDKRKTTLLDYDAEIMHQDDPDAIEWFFM